MPGFSARQAFHARHQRHIDIHKNNVGHKRAGKPLQRRLTVGGGRKIDGYTNFLYGYTEYVAVVFVVVNQ